MFASDSDEGARGPAYSTNFEKRNVFFFPRQMTGTPSTRVELGNAEEAKRSSR